MSSFAQGYDLFKDREGFNTSRLPLPYSGWAKISNDPAVFSRHNTRRQRATLHRYVMTALLNLADPANADICVIKIADGSYASEWARPDGTVLVAYATSSGVLNASVYNPLTTNCNPIPSLAIATTEFDASSILALYLLIEADKNKAEGYTLSDTVTHELLQNAQTEFAATGALNEVTARLACDDLYFALSYGALSVNISGGNIQLLTNRRLANNEFATGTVICGTSSVLIPTSVNRAASGGPKTIADLKAIVEPYTSTLSWSPEEEAMIPVFPDNTEVGEEVETICQRFVKSRDWKNPLNNPCWRGITAYGKSTGVKMLACILHTPLVWMTCATTTEVEDFLSKHVPNTDDTAPTTGRTLPDFGVIAFDPARAYEMITGKANASATSEEAFAAYVEAVKAAAQNETDQPTQKNPFKIVESDFVRALVNGWIVEVQEFSRIRDSGTLVGLNNFSDPGSVIPLVDGRHVRRHPNAMVCWTDNIGLTSCRKVDASVLRRFSYIIDSTEMTKDRALRRVAQNTGCSDSSLLDKMYNVWAAIDKYCKEHDITDEGVCSLAELETWVALTMMDGEEAVKDTCLQAVVSKLSSDVETQKELSTAVDLALGETGLLQ